MPQPLPANTYVPGSLLYQAYERCLDLERTGQDEARSLNRPLSPQMNARILGYMIHETPEGEDRDPILSKIHSCGENEDLQALARTCAVSVFSLCERSSAFPSDPV